jgi:hypothetical protein
MHCLLVLVYIQDLTCHRLASRVSCHLFYKLVFALYFLPGRQPCLTSPLLHLTWHISRYSLRAHCIGGDTILRNLLCQTPVVSVGHHGLKDLELATWAGEKVSEPGR